MKDEAHVSKALHDLYPQESLRPEFAERMDAILGSSRPSLAPSTSERARSRRNWGVPMVAAVGVLAIVGAAAVIGFNRSADRPALQPVLPVNPPENSLVESSLATALSIVKTTDQAVTVSGPAPSVASTAPSVVSTEPSAVSTAPQTTTIPEPSKMIMPRIENLDRQGAFDQLKTAGWTGESVDFLQVTEEETWEPALIDRVITQSPKAGEKLEKSDAVSLVVGKIPTWVPFDFTGRNLVDITAYVDEKTRGTSQVLVDAYVEGTKEQSGQILGQDLKPHTPVDVGTPLHVQVYTYTPR